MRQFFGLLMGLFLVMAATAVHGQIGHGTKEPSRASVVEMFSPSKGLLIPRVELTSTTDFAPIQGEDETDLYKVNSLLVYNTATTTTGTDDVTPGYYYWTVSPARWNRLITIEDITTTVTADNGLTENGGHIQIGGNLTKSTTVTTTENYNLTLATTTAGNDGKLLITGLDKTKVQAADETTGITDHLLAVGTNNVVKALKAALPRFFYMPSIIIPTHSSQVESGEIFGTINLYQKYVEQFGSPKESNPNKTTTLPILPANELDYYITWYDEDVFATVSVGDNGVMTYTIQPGADVNEGSFMNIVFAVKE